MGVAEQYKRGILLAEIPSRARIRAEIRDWFPIDLLAECFRDYYASADRIARLGGHQQLAWRKLRECAEAGWGAGVQDLDDAFDHLERNTGFWQDNNTDRYTPVGEFVFLQNYRGRVEATAAVNYATQRNIQCQRIRGEIMNRWERQIDEFKQQIRSRSVRQVLSALPYFKDMLTEAAPYVWADQIHVERGHNIWIRHVRPGEGHVFEPFTLERGLPEMESHPGLGLAVSTVNWFSMIRTAIDTYTEAGRQLPDDSAAAISAMQAVAGFFPVFGNIYVEALSTVPLLARKLRVLINNKTREIDQTFTEIYGVGRGIHG